MFLFGVEFLDKCTKLISKVFSSQLIIASVTLIGLCGCFLLCLFFACIGGDISKNIKKLKGLKGDFINTADLNYDIIVKRPFSYSFIKRLPVVVIGLILFFGALSVAASVALSQKFDDFAALMLLTVCAVGLLLIVLAVLFSGSKLKKATKWFYAAQDRDSRLAGTVSSFDSVQELPSPIISDCGDFVNEKAADDDNIKDFTLENDSEKAANDLCNYIDRLTKTKKPDYLTLSNLYSQISILMTKASSAEVLARLSAALKAVDYLVDSAMKSN